ncbi:SDR family NAD(P)-dependent oxidoreductase [Streptomyces sp. NPDC048504]|uniref:SDR family NAD(P)-dependent oxidoreductase n=1 Tax=Streptomyces sp. NPDC048504 TaxID=3365559 RepID=UPI003722A08D
MPGGPLGRAFALALADAGARVILVGRNETALADAAAQVEKDGGQARTASCDVSDPADVSALTAELADEEVSLLVNNAGVAGPVRPLVDITNVLLIRLELWACSLRARACGPDGGTSVAVIPAI